MDHELEKLTDYSKTSYRKLFSLQYIMETGNRNPNILISFPTESFILLR
jgi:hypothetical protein